MGRRQERLSVQIAKEVSQLLQQEVKDPRLGFVTVQRVDLNDDLSFAKVFVSVLGGEKDEKSAEIALKRSVAFIRSKLGKALKIRQVPEIRFMIDHNLDHSDRISELLAGLNDPDLSEFDKEDEQ